MDFDESVTNPSHSNREIDNEEEEEGEIDEGEQKVDSNCNSTDILCISEIKAEESLETLGHSIACILNLDDTLHADESVIATKNHNCTEVSNQHDKSMVEDVENPTVLAGQADRANCCSMMILVD